MLVHPQAENHYTTDYPDEDLAWDDQFGRNPYRYARDDIPGSDDLDEEYQEDGDGDEGWDRIGKPTHDEY